MRDSNHRCVLLNRSSVTITSTVYDRRGLDCNSEIPLINSLNHLTYLTSNSAKVRETVADDGALIRLVAILHDCHITLDEWPNAQVEDGLNMVEKIARERKLAMIAWKWTLAFQCLVLTGTRGTEQIRKQVVSSGVIPILATVLDNYLLLEKGYDFMSNAPIEFDLKNCSFSDDYDVSQEVDIESLILRYKQLAKPDIMQLNTSFSELWQSTMETEKGLNDLETDNYDNITVSIPRNFFWGKIVPKADDVIWSLQLLAFISKYTHMKPHLQKAHLVKTLSLRNALSIARKKHEELDLSSLRISPEIENTTELDESDFEAEPDETTVDFDDPFLINMKSRCKTIGKELSFHNSAPQHSHKRSSKLHLERSEEMAYLRQEFRRKWNYDTMPKDLDDETYDHLIHAPHFNLFPLVERFTIKKENERDMTYWSSVIMRNSCRKNETTGVRQCANFACGKWEDFPKRFAKCRRCKRTKYCSRGCQLQSWNYHRYWCQEVSGSSAGTVSNGSGRITPNQVHSTTDSIAESAVAGTPNVENGRDILADNADISRRINGENALPDGA
ncbi:LANO_0D07118g1_1 [Lachancea nothofagi CBS 11611]|uniref:LANO_0D07118g1_1 n=1 Tax=Lachancea nothofagi CBS 11611 TaxID=1266666 RepID=A0A1G4JHU9_9SACH|nr:LANO_0D07118g1_1 [Lachancea nothofagi CBS 11611]